VITRKNIQIEFELLREPVNLEEVVVRARQADVFASASSTYLDREELRSAVGGGADPLLSLDGLPGLASTGEFASFSVRGRGPRDNLLFVDDFPFDKAVHFDATLGEDEDVGGGGRFSIFAPNVISGAEFSPGGWGSGLWRPGSIATQAGSRRMAIQALQQVCALTLRAMKLVTTALPVSLKTQLCSFLLDELDFGALFETIEELDIGEPVLRDIIVKSVIPINQNHTFEILLIDTHEDYYSRRNSRF
jgi:hypothetical protein